MNDKIAAAFDDQADTQALAKKFEQDREHLKQVLLKGKQVQEGEMATVQQRAGVDDEVLAQAEGIFGRKEVSGDGVDRSLEYLERGVKRIIKGME